MQSIHNQRIEGTRRRCHFRKAEPIRRGVYAVGGAVLLRDDVSERTAAMPKLQVVVQEWQYALRRFLAPPVGPFRRGNILRSVYQ
ncbi:MAG: hypothetical protein ACYDBJ_11240 [Aggregatilineales bacterium]